MKALNFVGDIVEGVVSGLWTGFKYLALGSFIGAVIVTAIIGAILYTM